MRARDPCDDPPRKRRPEQYRGPPVTLANIRTPLSRLFGIPVKLGVDGRSNARRA